jgi:D-alanyl-D-alanine carboxypeptidase/D-alanyl-D-alanine-endopeptidase (penicillin-binding protein 4)
MSSLSFAKVKMLKDNYSYALFDLHSKKLITSHNVDTPMVLASVSKLFTMHYALSQLGGDFQFKTRVYFDGKIENGVAKGKLYLVGSGDPYLVVPNLISLIQQLKSAGIKKLKGEFFYDDTNLSFTSRLSSLGLEDQPDNPSMGALNLEFNRFKVWGRGQKIHPPLKSIKLQSKNKSSNGLKFDFQSEKKTETWQVNKKEDLRFIEDLPVRNSSVFTAEFFRFLCLRHGLELPTAMSGKLGKKAKLMATHSSLPVSRLAYLGLEYSNNLIAETLLKTAAKQQSQKILSSEKSSKLMHEWLMKTLEKVNWKHSSFKNGSGLTLDNQVNAQTMVEYLKALDQKQYDKQSFLSLLSINAHSGGLAKRLRSPQHAYRVHGKTGSLYYVSNLAGYLIANSGKKYAFAIMMTDKSKREQLSTKNSPENNKLRANSKRWFSSSIKEQDNLLIEWISKY